MADDDVPDPFSNPLFAHFQRAMASQGPLQWDVARQTALMAATQGVAEHNVEPQRRIAIESLAPIIAMRVAEVTESDAVETSRLEVVNRATWVQVTLEAWKPYFDSLARSLAQPLRGDVGATGSKDAATESEDESSDAMLAMLANVSRLIAPSMLGMSVGNLVGRLAVHTFGQYDLPLPREPHGQLLVVVGNIDAFANEWSIPRDDMTIWALAHELTSHTVFSAPHLRSAVSRLVSEFAGGFRVDPGTFSEGIARLDVSSGDPMKMLDSLLSDPTVLLGASRSPTQDRVAPLLDAAVTAVVGYVDHCVDVVASRVLGDAARISEAVRRRRVAGGNDRLFVERLLGVDLTRERVEIAHRFVDGVLERAGEAGLAQLLTREGSLPTPAELEAPGLWLARLETTG